MVLLSEKGAHSVSARCEKVTEEEEEFYKHTQEPDVVAMVSM